MIKLKPGGEKLMASAIRAGTGDSSYASARSLFDSVRQNQASSVVPTVLCADSLSASTSGTKNMNRNSRRRPRKWTRQSQRKKTMVMYKEKKREEKEDSSTPKRKDR